MYSDSASEIENTTKTTKTVLESNFDFNSRFTTTPPFLKSPNITKKTAVVSPSSNGIPIPLITEGNSPSIFGTASPFVSNVNKKRSFEGIDPLAPMTPTKIARTSSSDKTALAPFCTSPTYRTRIKKKKNHQNQLLEISCRIESKMDTMSETVSKLKKTVKKLDERNNILEANMKTLLDVVQALAANT